MRNLIASKVGGNIKQLEWVSAPKMSPRYKQVAHGIAKYFKRTADDLDYIRFRKHKLVFTGENKLPSSNDPRWKKIPYRRNKTKAVHWNQPFFELEKYHIVDAIMQLGLEFIFEKTSKCSMDHADLNDDCYFFACNERRWAFTELNKKYLEIGNKYFINKESNNNE